MCSGLTEKGWTRNAIPQGVNATMLEEGVQAAFAEPDRAHPRRTRALVVVHAGRIVAERYAPGFDADMPLIGWSMTKMAINALAGILVQDGALRLSDTALLPEWRHDGDLRREITLDQLLRMTSGLSFNENYADQSSDILQMLFVQGDQARFAASKPLVSSPGTQWSYSGGTFEHHCACDAPAVRRGEGLSAFPTRALVRAAGHAQRST